MQILSQIALNPLLTKSHLFGVIGYGYLIPNLWFIRYQSRRVGEWFFSSFNVKKAQDKKESSSSGN
jgi:hypothetical protein